RVVTTRQQLGRAPDASTVRVDINGGLIFFFSSRRRHTRSKRDWSSDVCSSDLAMAIKIDAVFTSNLSLRVQENTAIIPCSADSRSEERRVGKECRSRGWGCRENDKGLEPRAPRGLRSGGCEPRLNPLPVAWLGT